MLIYDTRLVERWEKRRCEGQITDIRAETFYNRIEGEIYDSQKGWERIYDMQV